MRRGVLPTAAMGSTRSEPEADSDDVPGTEAEDLLDADDVASPLPGPPTELRSALSAGSTDDDMGKRRVSVGVVACIGVWVSKAFRGASELSRPIPSRASLG